MLYVTCLNIRAVQLDPIKTEFNLYKNEIAEDKY